MLALISLGEQLLYFRSLKPLITLPPDLTIHALAIQCLEASVCPSREGTDGIASVPMTGLHDSKLQKPTNRAA